MYFLIAMVNGALTYKIRQMKKLASQREEKENVLKLYNTFFNSLSHELQTPISTIIGATDTLKDVITLSKENKIELLDEISIASFRLNEQVENLLNMSRMESGHLKLKKDWCDVNELIHSTVNKLRKKAGNRQFRIFIEEKFPLFSLDFGIMEQVLHNLLNNAVQYTPENSILTIKADYATEIVGHFDEEPAGGIHRDATSHILVLTVSDNGTGFPANEIGYVFDKFYRLKKTYTGGSGLGLSIVKGFIEAHKGTITLKNIPAGGAEFTLHIPTRASYINALKNE